MISFYLHTSNAEKIMPNVNKNYDFMCGKWPNGKNGLCYWCLRTIETLYDRITEEKSEIEEEKYQALYIDWTNNFYNNINNHHHQHSRHSAVGVRHLASVTDVQCSTKVYFGHKHVLQLQFKVCYKHAVHRISS